MPCFAAEATVLVDRAINRDFEIYNGIKLVRNNNEIIFPKLRTQDSFEDLSNSLTNFFDTHTIHINLSSTHGNARKGGDDGDGGFFNLNSKAVKKEKKYSKYAFLVLLGIFGLTGPLFMKILSVIAAQALMASKAALIIVGSVALKKLFEKKEEKPIVKVATVPLYDAEEGDHDRLGTAQGTSSYVSSYQNKYNTSPYLGYYNLPSNENSNIKHNNNNNNYEYAPIIYGKRYSPNKLRKSG